MERDKYFEEYYEKKRNNISFITLKKVHPLTIRIKHMLQKKSCLYL